ncbi:NYN domain-containing protein [Paenibacillus sp. FSL L8-0709]|uniref:NYN domain-containing protein n=1 Tax=Paenibacillus sp. FSL L8-0709 TaxID=2975312 RepID=UPI0030FC62F9
MLKVGILIDEMNAVSQLHNIGVEGISPWKVFYEAITTVLEKDYGTIDCTHHFYGALPPKYANIDQYYNRSNFFNALSKHGVNVHKGISEYRNGTLVEKGVDCLIAMDMLEMSVQYDMLFLFSADADLVPAVERAKKNSKVFAILSRQQPAKFIKTAVDAVVPLEAILKTIDEQYIIKLTKRAAV